MVTVMSKCLSRKPFIVLLENRIRQIIYTMLGENKVNNYIYVTNFNSYSTIRTMMRTFINGAYRRENDSFPKCF